jgi:hypothetical protein
MPNYAVRSSFGPAISAMSVWRSVQFAHFTSSYHLKNQHSCGNPVPEFALSVCEAQIGLASWAPVTRCPASLVVTLLIGGCGYEDL